MAHSHQDYSSGEDSDVIYIPKQNETIVISDDSSESDEDIPIVTADQIVKGLNSKKLATKIRILKKYRNTFSCPKIHVASLLEAGIEASLLQVLDNNDSIELQYEIDVLIRQICSHFNGVSFAHAVVEKGIIPILKRLLERGPELSAHVVHTIGTLAGAGPFTRDAVLNEGVLWSILPYMRPDTPFPLLYNTIFAYSKMCRHYYMQDVKIEQVYPGLPFIAEIISKIDQNEQLIVPQCVTALRNLSKGSAEHIDAIQAVPNLLSYITAILSGRIEAAIESTLLLLDNMLDGTDAQKERCLDSDFVDHLIKCMRSKSHVNILRSAAITASNILAGTHQQIQCALDKNILDAVIDLLGHRVFMCQWEASKAIDSLCQNGTVEQVGALLSAGLRAPPDLVYEQTSVGEYVVKTALDRLSQMLEAAAISGEVEELCLKLEGAGIVDRIDELQHHKNDEIYNINTHIIDTYFSMEGEYASTKDNQE